MSYSNIISQSAIISVTHEEPAEDGSSYTVVLRVLNDAKWKKMIHAILKSSHEDETFGVTIRQEYYLDDNGTPSFVWSMLLWGDLDDALSSLTPILSKRGAPPAPPASLRVNTPTARPRKIVKKDSVVTETELPFKRPAIKDKDVVVKARDVRTSKAPRAFVEGVTD